MPRKETPKSRLNKHGDRIWLFSAYTSTDMVFAYGRIFFSLSRDIQRCTMEVFARYVMISILVSLLLMPISIGCATL